MLSSKVKLPQAMHLRALCGARFVASLHGIEKIETVVAFRVDASSLHEGGAVLLFLLYCSQA